ncbi:glycerophosphodiester phosphodiesterase family protein [Microvirga sp. 2MCAF38]|uniref:glycerophosphodiester phosphodiesterase family protein n=1 Tax=Microvirga sp. 2MCAF38 TaxID=3232989 RepID=UPI003F9E956D
MKAFIAIVTAASLSLLTGIVSVRPASEPAYWPAKIDELNQSLDEDQLLFIAHAGGGYEKHGYTNSLDALESSYKDGFRFFELDFMKTTDGKIVCIHDWGASPLTYDQFKSKRYDASNPLMRWNNCTLNSLARFLAKHPDASVILDTKEEQTKAVFFEIASHLRATQDIAIERIIPQAYSLAEAQVYRYSGFPNIIYTIYKAPGATDVVEACDLGGVAITAPIQWILGDHLKITSDPASNPFASLSDDCPVFVHPIRKPGRLLQAMEKVPQIRGIYTHVLHPSLPDDGA